MEESSKAYQAWCESLNERTREEQLRSRDAESQRRKQLEEDKQFRDELAREAYELWLEMKVGIFKVVLTTMF
jgi:hypothetical protein